jgi:hypothetical protein
MTLQTPKPRLVLRLLVVALVSALIGGGVYFQGWYTECRPGRPGGEACNIAMGLGLIFAVALSLTLFLLGLAVVLILQWLYKRRVRRAT